MSELLMLVAKSFLGWGHFNLRIANWLIDRAYECERL